MAEKQVYQFRFAPFSHLSGAARIEALKKYDEWLAKSVNITHPTKNKSEPIHNVATKTTKEVAKRPLHSLVQVGCKCKCKPPAAKIVKSTIPCTPAVIETIEAVVAATHVESIPSTPEVVNAIEPVINATHFEPITWKPADIESINSIVDVAHIQPCETTPAVQVFSTPHFRPINNFFTQWSFGYRS